MSVWCEIRNLHDYDANRPDDHQDQHAIFAVLLLLEDFDKDAHDGTCCEHHNDWNPRSRIWKDSGEETTCNIHSFNEDVYHEPYPKNVLPFKLEWNLDFIMNLFLQGLQDFIWLGLSYCFRARTFDLISRHRISLLLWLLQLFLNYWFAIMFIS